MGSGQSRKRSLVIQDRVRPKDPSIPIPGYSPFDTMPTEIRHLIWADVLRTNKFEVRDREPRTHHRRQEPQRKHPPRPVWHCYERFRDKYYGRPIVHRAIRDDYLQHGLCCGETFRHIKCCSHSPSVENAACLRLVCKQFSRDLCISLRLDINEKIARQPPSIEKLGQLQHLPSLIHGAFARMMMSNKPMDSRLHYDHLTKTYKYLPFEKDQRMSMVGIGYSIWDRLDDMDGQLWSWRAAQDDTGVRIGLERPPLDENIEAWVDEITIRPYQPDGCRLLDAYLQAKRLLQMQKMLQLDLEQTPSLLELLRQVRKDCGLPSEDPNFQVKQT